MAAASPRLHRRPSQVVRADGRGLQHRLRHPRLPRCRRRMEARPPVMLQDFLARRALRASATGRAASSAGGACAPRGRTPRIARSRRSKRRAASRSSSRRTSTACTSPPAAATSSTCTGASTSCAAWTASGACRASSVQARAASRAIPRSPRSTPLEAPDGDAELDGVDFAAFDVPACDACGGLLKPDVVFFGESVPAERVAARVRGARASGRHARRRLVADGLLGLPLRAGRWPTPASRSRPSISAARAPTICWR